MSIDFLVQHAEVRLAANPNEEIEMRAANKNERDEIVGSFNSDAYRVSSKKIKGGYKLTISAIV